MQCVRKRAGKEVLLTEPVTWLKVLTSVGAPMRVRVAPEAKVKAPEVIPLLTVTEELPMDHWARLNPDP